MSLPHDLRATAAEYRASCHIAAMDAARPNPGRPALAEQLEPLVRRVLAPNRSPFTYTGTQTYLVGRGDEVAVIDPGPDEPAHLAALDRRDRRRRRSRRSCAPTPTATIRPPPRRWRSAPARRSSAARRWCSTTTARAPTRAFDPSYAPDRVLADGEAMTGPGWTLTARRHARPHLEPPVLRAGGKRRAVHRRPRDGLVDQRRRPARRRHGRLHGEPREAPRRATTASITPRTARRSTTRASWCAG